MHRNSFKRFYDQDNIYYIVSKTQDNFPYFKELIFCDLLVEELKLCKKLKKFKLYAFSIIYDHINLLIQPGDEYNISKVMQALKKNVSQDINKIMSFYTVGENSNSRLLKVDINLFTNQYQLKYKNIKNPFPPFQWQRSFYDHVIRDEKDFETHLDYTLDNDVNHNLPENWKHTSLNYEDLIDEC